MNNEVNLKDIREVPILEEIKGTETVLINDDGAAQQLPLEMVKSYVTPPPVEYDVDIELVGTWDAEQGNYVTTYSINKLRSFTELRQMILDNSDIKTKLKIKIQPPDYVGDTYVQAIVCNGVSCGLCENEFAWETDSGEMVDVISICSFPLIGGIWVYCELIIDSNNNIIHTECAFD